MRVLLLGGTSEIGLAILSALELAPDTEVTLAGRDVRADGGSRKDAAVPPCFSCGLRCDGVASHQAFADSVCAGGVPDLVIAATGVLIPQPSVEADVSLAAAMIEANFTGQVTTLLAFGSHMKARGSGTIVVLSSVAAVRPRKFNSVYGAAKAGLDAFARGYADSLHGTGVRVLLVRPGFVTGRMTAGMAPAPLATTPEKVGVAVASALRKPASGLDPAVWVPRAPGLASAAVMRLRCPRVAGLAVAPVPPAVARVVCAHAEQQRHAYRLGPYRAVDRRARGAGQRRRRVSAAPGGGRRQPGRCHTAGTRPQLQQRGAVRRRARALHRQAQPDHQS